MWRSVRGGIRVLPKELLFEELEAKGESLENVEKYREKTFVEICGEGREGD
jgi:hypothetical protein